MPLSFDDARQALRSAGLRCTVCRVAVLQYLADATRPLTHGEVTGGLEPEGLDKSTIYRSLVEMADAGLLSRLDAGDHVWRFELREEPSSEEFAEHPHFMCVDCGGVTCLPDVKIRVSPGNADRVPVTGRITEVLLKGYCVQCR